MKLLRRVQAWDIRPWAVASLVVVLSSCDLLQTKDALQPPAPPSPTVERGPVSQAPLPPPPTEPVTEPTPAAPKERPGRARTPGNTRVALLVPLSGTHRDLGQAMFNAAQMAVFDGADRRFELLPYDTRGRSDGAASAARQAIEDGASLILGPLLSASVRAVAPIASSAGVPVIAFSSDDAVAGGGIFILGFTPAGEVRRVVAQAASLGAQRFAAVVPDDAYGAKVAAALKSAVETTGGTITRVELLDPKATDFTPVIRRLTEGGRPAEARPGTMPASGPSGQPQPSVAASSIPGTPSARPSALATSPAPGASPPALPFDALLVAVGGKRLQTFAAYLSAAGIDGSRVRLLGTGIWDEPGLGAEPALVGGWFAAAPPDLRQDFARQYRQVFGDAPPRLASLAYDATAMAAVLAQGLAGGPFLPEYLTDPSGFLGRDGLFRLGADGIAERKLAVLEITRDGAVVISDAPSSFAGF